MKNGPLTNWSCGGCPIRQCDKGERDSPGVHGQRRPGSGLYRRYRAFRLMRNVSAVVSAACLAYPA